MEAIVWQILSSFHAALIVFGAWPSLFFQVRGIRREDRDLLTYTPALALGALTVAVQVLNASGLTEPSGGLYFSGLCAGPLAIAAVHFARLLFRLV